MIDEPLERRLALFKAELAELLARHSASIAFDYGPNSDTHGLYDERIVVELAKPKRPDGRQPFDGFICKLADGYGVSADDLTETGKQS